MGDKDKTVEISSFLQKNPAILKAVLAAKKGIKAGGKADPKFAPPEVLKSARVDEVPKAPPTTPEQKAEQKAEPKTTSHPHAVHGVPVAAAPKPVLKPVVAKNGRWF